MGLIQCPECNTEVSNKAEVCPKCAYPIAEHFNPSQKGNAQTIEQTGKRFKLQILLSILVMIVGIIMSVSQVNKSEPSQGAIIGGFLICIIGAIWLIVVKFCTWWYHG